MVMCNTPMMAYAASPPNVQYGGYCPVNGVTCNQRYPTAPYLTIGSVPPALPLPPSPTMIQCTRISSTSTTPNASPPPQGNIPVSPTNSTTVFTLTPIPTNYQLVPPPQGNIPVNSNALLNNNTTYTYNPLPTGYQYVPYSHINQPIPCKPSSNQNNTVSNVVPCNQAVYTCNPILPTSALVPCQQRIVNGTSVLQYTPGMCQLPPPTGVYTNGNVEMCSLPSSPVVPNNPPVTFPVSSMSIAQTVYTTTATSWKQSYGMEQVWQLEFRKLFSNYYPHVWILVPVSNKPPTFNGTFQAGVMHENVDSAKVRFCCAVCGHGWTSMKGRVAFWFTLSNRSEGIVCLKLYGQQCERCKLKDVFEPAMWYPEEVAKVLVNIYNRVGQVYYGFLQAPYHKTRRAGKPRTPHNSELCQACQDGVCAERR